MSKKRIIFIFLILSAILVGTYKYNLFSTNQEDTINITNPVNKKEIKKVFILTGEASGERLGAWYLNKIKRNNPNVTCHAIGGQNLKKAGALIFEDFSKLTLGIVGITALIKHIPTLWRMFGKIKQYILDNNFDTVVLVDCPLINLALMRKLKKENNKIKIIYIAPPELWIWGKWGIDKLLKKYCDQITVIYPFEVDWYAQQGLHVFWEGYPFYQDFAKYFKNSENKENQIAILLGSRKSELETTLPIFAQVIKLFIQNYPGLKIILPIPPHFSQTVIENIKVILSEHDINLDKILIVQNEEERYQQLAKCCLAITKPGTTTLELALLQVPTIITYKVPLLTYWLAKMTFQVPYVGLPNLLLNDLVCPELIQSECNAENIFDKAKSLYKTFLNKTKSYLENLEKLLKIRTILASEG